MSTKTTIEKADEEGWAAYAADAEDQAKPREKNPYPASDPCHAAWASAYNAAEQRHVDMLNDNLEP